MKNTRFQKKDPKTDSTTDSNTYPKTDPKTNQKNGFHKSVFRTFTFANFKHMFRKFVCGKRDRVKDQEYYNKFLEAQSKPRKPKKEGDNSAGKSVEKEGICIFCGATDQILQLNQAKNQLFVSKKYSKDLWT